MARIRFPGSPQRVAPVPGPVREPREEEDWYKTPQGWLRMVQLAQALGDPERGLIPRGVRAVEASAAEGRREDVQADIQRGLEAARATFTPEQAPGIGQATQGPDPRAVAQEMERRGTPIGVEGAEIAQEYAREQAQERRAAQAAQAAPAQEGLEAVYLDLEAALEAEERGYLKRHQMTRQQQAVVAQISREEKWDHEGVYSPKVRTALKKRVDEQAATARQHADTAASPLFGGRAASKRKDARERDIRRRLMRELGVETVGDVIAHTYEHFQEHGELSGEVMRDAWLALEDAAAADPQYIRENMGAKEARLEFLRALNTMRSGKPIDEWGERGKRARALLAEKKLADAEAKASRAGRNIKKGTSWGDFLSQVKASEWNKPVGQRSDQTVNVGGESITITYDSDPSGATQQLLSLSSGFQSKRAKDWRTNIQRIGGRAGQTEPGTARQQAKEGSQELKRAKKDLEKAVDARRNFMIREGLVASGGRTPEMDPSQRASMSVFDADITRARARVKDLEGANPTASYTTPGGNTVEYEE